MTPAAEDWLTDSTSCRITTRGRLTGADHVVTVWFCRDETTVFVLSRHGENGDWVRNIRADPAVTLSHRRHTKSGLARVVDDAAEHRRGREAMYAKYSLKHQGLEAWLSEDGTVVAIDLEI